MIVSPGWTSWICSAPAAFASHQEARRLGPSSRRNNESPCLLYSSDDREPNTVTMRRPSTNNLYHNPLPGEPYRSRYVFGSSHGWLAAADEKSNPHLFNPITGAQIDLPPAKTLAPIKIWLHEEIGHAIYDITPTSPVICESKMTQTFMAEETRHHLYMKAALSSDPAGGNCTAVIIHKPHNQLSFARIGDGAWTWIHAHARGKYYDDCFYDETDGVFYAVVCTGEVHAIDLSGPAPAVSVVTEAVESYEWCNKYIARAPWGDLVQVSRYHDAEWRTRKIRVHRVDLDRDKSSPEIDHDLVEIRDLQVQGNALFVGFGVSFFVAVKDFPMLAPNCIYLSHDKAKFEHLDKIKIEEVLVYNLADGTFTDFLPHPNRCLNFPPPIWIKPSWSVNK